MSFRINEVRASRGLAWVGGGFALFLRHPMGFTLLFFIGLLPTLVLSLVPVLGALLAFAMGPPITLGLANGARAARAGQPVRAALMLEPVLPGAEAARRRALLLLSLLYTLVCSVLLMLAALAGGDALDQMMQIVRAGRTDMGAQIQALLREHPELQIVGLLPALSIALVSVVFWHAPMLVWWQGQGVAQSLFSSTLACWRNRGAFALYALAWTGALMAFLVASSLLLLIVGAAQLTVLAWQPGLLLFVIAFYVSVFFSYDDCFAHTPE